MTAVRSLVIAPQWLGDAVLAEPLLRRLHRRGEQITVAALPWVAPVFCAMPQVAEVIELPFQHGALQWRARRRIAAQLQGRFEIAYVLPNSIKSALLPLLAGIPRRVGYLGEARIGLLTDRLKNPAKDQRPPMVQWYARLSGEEDDPQERPQLGMGTAWVDSCLSEHALERGGYRVLAPGAEFGSAKRWPSQRFAELAGLLELPLVILGSAKEAGLCAEIAQGWPDRCLNLGGKTTLAQAMALISAAAGVVSNDSGLMHVAAAFGVPQVALFGSSSPRHTPPLNERARVVWLKDDAHYQPRLDCAPCFARECPLGHTRCLNDISAQQVLALLDH